DINRDAGAKRTGRNEPKHRLLAADDERVAGIVAALKPDDALRAFRQPIDDLASHSIARAMARRRKGFHGLRPTSLSARSSARKTFCVVISSRERGKPRSARVGVASQSSFNAASGGVRTDGRCAASRESGTTVPRAQLDMA